jgi:ABC-2 type transport system ATP-binding protein
MDHGRLVACDNPTALRSLLPGTLLEVRGPAPDSVSPLLSRLAEVQRIEVFGETLHLTVGDVAKALPVVRAALQREGHMDVRLRPILPSLEDVFVTLLRDRDGSRSKVTG